MNDDGRPLPRWGNEGRDRKAAAILWTLVHQCGERIKHGMWIDVGCGSGGIAAALAPAVNRVTGVDPEPWQSWSELAAAHGNLSFQAACFDTDDVPIAAASADVVVCNQVYEHVHDPRKLLANIHRVLKPGGYCYFAGPNLLWPVEPHVFWPFVHWLPRPFARRLMAALGSQRALQLDAYSVSYWTLLAWFREAGFTWGNAIPARLSAELDLRGLRSLAAGARRCPQFVLKPAAFLSPGFVFILRRMP